jgi:hypothetical protein
MSTRPPRVLLVTRPTELERLVARHGTLGQARFFLKTRKQAIEPIERANMRQHAALSAARRTIPSDWRSARLDRAELSRFVFEPEDVIVALGQDGLVANVAKYLVGQRVIGVNPDPERYEGVLVRHRVEALGELLMETYREHVRIEERTMVEARLFDGQSLRALNELYIGHRTHQSSRYRIRLQEREERQSSSGVLVSTGTGSTGWTRSIHRQCHVEWALPAPTDPSLVFFVREAWPSVASGTTITQGILAEGSALEVVSEMNDEGVIFGDGIEDDRVELPFGAEVRIARAADRLRLVLG